MIPPLGKYLGDQVGLEPTTGRFRIFAKYFILDSTK